MKKNKRLYKILNKARYSPSITEIEDARSSFLNEIVDQNLYVTKVQYPRIPIHSYINKFITSLDMNKALKVSFILGSGFLVLVVGSIVLANSTNAANPNDHMYPIDRAAEQFRRVMIVDPVEELIFEQDILDERASELEELIRTNAAVEIIDEALVNVEKQNDQVSKRLRIAEDNENSDEGELKRIRERLEVQQKLNLGLMLQVQEKYKLNEGLDEENGSNGGVSNQIEDGNNGGSNGDSNDSGRSGTSGGNGNGGSGGK
jgi:hypothetical protein